MADGIEHLFSRPADVERNGDHACNHGADHGFHILNRVEAENSNAGTGLKAHILQALGKLAGACGKLRVAEGTTAKVFKQWNASVHLLQMVHEHIKIHGTCRYSSMCSNHIPLPSHRLISAVCAVF